MESISSRNDDLAELRSVSALGLAYAEYTKSKAKWNCRNRARVQDFQSDVYWVADNQAKGISQKAIVTSHANAKFSRQNWDASVADIVLELESAVLALSGKARRRECTHTQLKKWRYSVPLTTYRT